MSTLLVEMQKIMDELGEEEKMVNGAVHEVYDGIKELKESPLNRNQANTIQVRKALRPEFVEFGKNQVTIIAIAKYVSVKVRSQWKKMIMILINYFN